MKAKTTAQPRQTMREAQSEKTRRVLLEVSLRLFVERGYSGTTVRDIAKRAKVSPGLMFHYFPSKQAILEEHAKTVASGIDSVVAMLRESDQPLATFRQIAGMLLESFRDDYGRQLFLLANQVLSVRSIPESARRRVSAGKSMEASMPLIKAGQQRKEIRQGDPMAMAVTFWGALQGIAEVLAWNPNAPIPDAEDVVAILKA